MEYEQIILAYHMKNGIMYKVFFKMVKERP